VRCSIQPGAYENVILARFNDHVALMSPAEVSSCPSQGFTSQGFTYNCRSRALGSKCSAPLEKRTTLAQNSGMDKSFVIEKLRHHERELKAAGILHIRVFGSVARDEASTVSDVDLLADFDKSKRMTLVKVGSLQSRLSDMLGARVDLSSTEWMREPVKSKALREAVIVF
jgi:uncharacterized protein